MKSTLTAADVIADIEFELLQGSISRDELGQGIQTVRQHQNKIRNLAYDVEGDEDALQNVLNHQFQLNDMLLTLLQEMAGGIQDVRKTAEWIGEQRRGEEERPLFTNDDAPKPPLKSTEALTKTMSADAIHQKIDITANGRPIPFVNGFIRRLRVALHNLSLFYVNRMGASQASINQTQADWILHLNSVNRHQQEEIEHLTSLVRSLQEKIDSLDTK